MKEIELPSGYILLIDDEDYHWIEEYSYIANKHGYTFYAVRRFTYDNGYTRINYLHRDILKLPRYYPLVDHKDSNGLNNQKLNLRTVSYSQNLMKSKPYGESQYRGVHWDYNKWMVSITKDGIRKQVGRFNTQEEAALAYNQAATELFGEYARLNIING